MRQARDAFGPAPPVTARAAVTTSSGGAAIATSRRQGARRRGALAPAGRAAAPHFITPVHPHRLVGTALTVLEARRTQPPASLRRIRATLLRVPVAHHPTAAAAGREAGRARGMPILGADTLVGRAVLQAARRTDAHVLVARRLLVDATLGDAVVPAEVLGADRAASRARLTATVVVPADHQGRRRAAAMRTREQPGRPTTERPLRAERRATPRRRLELPPGALHQDGRLDELQRMHDGLHLAAPDLLGPATLGKRRDGADGLRVGLLFEDRLEVPVQAAQLASKLLLRRGASRADPRRRLFLKMAQEEPQQVPRLARGEIGRAHV